MIIFITIRVQYIYIWCDLLVANCVIVLILREIPNYFVRTT